MNKQILLLTMIFLTGVFPRVSASDTLIFTRIDGMTQDIAEQILTEAYKKIGITVKAETYPAERGLVTSNEGRVADGELARIEGLDKKYQNLRRIPVVVETIEGMAFVKAKSFKVTGWESLRPHRIGITIGVKFAEKGTAGMNVRAVPLSKTSFEQLNTGRLDVVVETRIDGMELIKSMNLTGVYPLEPPVQTIPLYHYLHKKNAHLIPKITAVLQEMKKEGRIEAIYREHLKRINSGKF